MATILLSAAGLAIGGSIGGTVLGLSTAVIGRAVGATLGRVIDNRLLGRGAGAAGAGRVERFRLMGAGEGDALGQVYGRMRVGGQVIWASRFLEAGQVRRGGKGAPQPTGYTYTVSLAVALCEGEITHLGRIWADGIEIDPASLCLNLYKGTEDQMPDPRIEAVEGAGAVPAYRGIAYVVIEDLDLGRFGNRVPQFNFEVIRAGGPLVDGIHDDLTAHVQAVALIPGSGEYALATTPVHLTPRFGEAQPVNLNTALGRADLDLSLDALQGALPRVGSVSLVVSWFGDDLRCSHCAVQPLVEQTTVDAEVMPWRAGGIGRAMAQTVPQSGGAAVYGGTPADQSVVEAITAIHARGQEVMFYPFLLMTQLAGNSLPDPWTGANTQPALPWRGRITGDLAPGRAGSSDGTATATAEVATFFGQAAADDFSVTGTTVSYHGPDEWSYRRFILHYAHLCAAAGGVGAFCLGSELSALTCLRDDQGYPAVTQLISLARDLRAILGAGCKIGYAADWTEYHGHQPAGTADKIFHLDPLWSDADIDFVGIDNYMPLADWRAAADHADAGAGAIYDLAYLRGNVAGGEGFDWYYHSPEARAAQIRTPITDGQGEPWIWRVKDLAGWWGNAHHNRVGGVRAATPTAWVAQSKPIWFTEIGCAAIHLGANEPNRFLDPKSSESALPYGSNGQRDDLMQQQYLRAVLGYYADPAHNPLSGLTGLPMVDLARAHVWAWDARPWPAFPLRADIWSDGGNYDRGHWLNGRAGARTLASVVAEICDRAGVTAYDVSRLFGLLRGYTPSGQMTGRAALEPLMLAYGFDVAERDGQLVFTTRGLAAPQTLSPPNLAVDDEAEATLALLREAEAGVAGRLRLGFADADADYVAATVETVHPDDPAETVAAHDLPLALSRGQARQIVDRWMAEARVARVGARFALPPSSRALGAGDVVRLNLPEGSPQFRIDRVEEAGLRRIEATRIEPEVYDRAPETAEPAPAPVTYAPPVPVAGLFLDLPLLRGDEVPHAPHAAFAARPWPGTVALYTSAIDADYVLDGLRAAAATLGVTETALAAAPAGRWDRAGQIRLRLVNGTLASASQAQVLAGANLAAIGDGSPDGWEVIQFANATLVAPDTWELTTLLRGQAGSDGVMPDLWPAGSYFVLLDARVTQIAQPVAARGVERHLRWGPAARALGDATYRYAALAFNGNGLRPYAVAHLSARDQGGDTTLGWVRRARVGGDDWTAPDIPLGEETESYLLRVHAGGGLRRELFLTQPQWRYDAALRTADALHGDLVVSVAQVSASFGAGPFRSLAL